MRRVAMLSVHACPLARLGGRDSGGMNVYVRELARELGRRGVAVDVFTRWRERDDPQIQSLGPNARVVHLLSGPIGYYSKMEVYGRLPEFTERLLAFTRGEGLAYDVVHSHYWLSAKVAAAVHGEWKAPVVQMFHTLSLVKAQALDDSLNGEAPTREATERDAVRVADRIVAASEIERSDLVTLYGADPNRIRVVPLGVDATLFHPMRQADARAALGRDACEYMILFVGRIEQIKGLDVLLEAVGDLLRDRPDLRRRTCLVVVGGAMDPDDDGTESERIAEMRRMARDHGIISNVDFVGSIDQEKLALYYAAADVCAVPSLTESFGLVALEAMASGTPVVATRVGGLQTVVTADSGILVPPSDASALAESIERLLDDMDLRTRLSAGARARARTFTWRRVADAVEDIYAEIAPARAGIAK